MKKMKKLFALLCAFVLTAALLTVFASAAAPEKMNADFEAKAQDLKSLGLFRGVSDTDFDLYRSPTRVEALVMLIRTLGRESEAQNGDWKHPFSDVPAWADKYVGYAYENGLTKGVSETSFGTGDASAAMYLTFMLRALGYSDADGDFSWNDPYTLARKNGILTDAVSIDDFMRRDVVEISYSALSAKIRDSSETLADKLIGMGVFSADDYKALRKAAPIGGKQIFVRDPDEFILPVEPKDPELPMSGDGPAIGE